MLVLTRRPGEVIDITVGAVRIEVMVVLIDGNKVRLGFKAPDDVKILRRELTERVAETERS